VALISRDQLATFVRRGSEPGEGVSLGEALGSLPRGLDLVLIEGFSWESIPRIVLVRGDGLPAKEYLARGEVLETVRTPDSPRAERPVFPDALIESLARALAARVRGTNRECSVADDASDAALDPSSV
jgi:hypothetical protein